MGLRAYGGAVLVGSAGLWMLSGIEHERPVLVSAREPIGALEAVVAAIPNDLVGTRSLAQQYLDARLPGLALGLIEGAPPSVRDDVRVEHVYARALIDAGRNNEALDAERQVVRACAGLAEGRRAAVGCDPTLLVSAVRRSDILRELLSLGVEDAPAHPEATRVAYQNATREARVVWE